jgi:DNA-binding CsgD family transcriptional regulator/chromosome segregation and condensation protein ScpB
LAIAHGALERDGVGIVISGAPGVGKTRIADELLTALATTGSQVVRMNATRAAATIPLGAAASLLDHRGAHDVGDHPTLAALHHAILEQAAAGSLVIGVDDAHLLDEATAGLLHHFARVGDARLVVTVRSGEPAPAAVDALWREELCRRLELQPLSRDELAKLLAMVLGGQVEQQSADNLWQVTAGNVLLLRELCRDALDRKLLIRRLGVWTWRGTPVLGARLQELLDARVGQLAGSEREAVALLALGEPLLRAVLVELTSSDTVDDLIERGLVIPTESDGESPTDGVRLSHPLYAESLRSRLGPLETADLYAQLASGLAGRASLSADDRLRVAVWSVTSGRPAEPGLLVAAANEALQRGDAALAERLARAGLRSPTGALVLGEALAALRRGEEAEAVLAPLAAGDDPHAEVRVAVARLKAHRSSALDLAAARAVAHAADVALADQNERDLVRAALADTLAYRDQINESGQLALAAMRSDDRTARLTALGPASTWLIQSGRGEDAMEAGRSLLTDLRWPDDDPPWAPPLLVGTLGSALLATGRFDEVDDLCAIRPTQPLAQPGHLHGVLSLLRGAAALLRGRPSTARVALREAVLGFERADSVGHRAWALALLAESEALLGEIDDAERALGAMPDVARGHVHYDRHRSVLWVPAAAGDISGAARRAVELADEARDAQAPFYEMTLAYTATRLGALDQAPRVAALAPKMQGRLAAALGDHAAGIAADDGGRLDLAAARLEEVGVLLFAAEAATQAALAHRKAVLTASAGASADHATALRASCEGARTPILAHGPIVAGLTPREREVALMAAQGMSSRQIADNLGVSVRTVDNQLGRVYTKLAVTGRRELAEMVDRLDT